jgi:hypothetical protein
LNAFVHRRGGFASNESYYVLKSLRATPLQVLDRGGDCSDKTESGTTAADPAYDLMFPNETGGYHDVRTMIGDPRVLASRLRVVRSLRGPADRIADYSESDHG